MAFWVECSQYIICDGQISISKTGWSEAHLQDDPLDNFDLTVQIKHCVSNHQITCNKWKISKTEQSGHLCSPSFAVVPCVVLMDTPSPQEDFAETWNSYSVSGVRPLTLRCNSLAGNVFLLSSRNEVLYDLEPFHSIWEENERRSEEVSAALMNAEIQLMEFHSRKIESGWKNKQNKTRILNEPCRFPRP